MTETDDRKPLLMELGAEKLADALLELADDVEEVDYVVDRMVSTPGELIERFGPRLLEVTASNEFVSLVDSDRYAWRLESVLNDISTGIDPVTGVNLVASFFEADRAAFDQCDDSDGIRGDVFVYRAADLFVEFAAQHPDKEWVSKLVVELCRDDAYGVRRVLMDRASAYLPEPTVRALIDSLRRDAERAANMSDRRSHLNMIESLARQLDDGELFEQTRIATEGEPSDAACLDIAEVHLDAGNAATALSWLERISLESNHARECDQLLLKVYGELGRIDERNRIALRLFENARSVTSLNEYLTIVDDADRNDVIAAEVAEIHAAGRLSSGDAEFLTELGLTDEAETYLLDRADQIDGDEYYPYGPIAQYMDSHGRSLCATLLYRALLNSILDRGFSRAYHHGIDYLRALDLLAPGVTDWGGRVHHAEYAMALRQRHGRKWSFWRDYD